MIDVKVVLIACVVIWPLVYAAGWFDGWEARGSAKYPFGAPPKDEQ